MAKRIKDLIGKKFNRCFSTIDYINREKRWKGA